MQTVATMKTEGRAKPALRNETLAGLADELGTLKARIAEIQAQARPLEERAEEIRSVLVASGQAAIDGSLYRVTVSHTNRVTLDQKAIRAAMPADWIKRFEASQPVVTVRVASRLVK